MTLIDEALTAFENGWTPVPLIPHEKRPTITAWTSLDYQTESDIEDVFKHAEQSHGSGIGLGLLLGEHSNGLVDVDLDHPLAVRVAEHLLPPTDMRTGRDSRRHSHHWYIASDDIPAKTQKYFLPDGSITVELRSTGGQTVVPPSTHPSGEHYRWEGEPWGGENGPRHEQGRRLSARVATLALVCVLINGWPQRGERHNAYLALAGGLLRYGGEEGIHPLWESVTPDIIRIISEATLDDDGPEARQSEVMGSTLKRLRASHKVQGFPTLARIMGEEHVKLIRDYARQIEEITGHASRVSDEPIDLEGNVDTSTGEILTENDDERVERLAALPAEERDPLNERTTSWEPIDLEPYLSRTIKKPEPGVLFRNDGHGLFYRGKVNSLYGSSESGKTWVAFIAAKTVMEQGESVMLIDCEDEPDTTLGRLKTLGMSIDTIGQHFSYIHPESPHSSLMVDRWGEHKITDTGVANAKALRTALELSKPSLIIVDGITALYGMHGLNTNDASNTDVLTSWMKSLTDGGRRTVLIIDHTSKGALPGGTPTGSQHKIAMVQGTALHVVVTTGVKPGSKGEVRLFIGKDRPGLVRQQSGDDTPTIAAEVHFDSHDRDNMDVTIVKPDAQTFVIADSPEQTNLLAYLGRDSDAIVASMRSASHPRMSKKEIYLALTDQIPDKRFKAALTNLKGAGKIRMTGAARATKYELTDAGKSD